TETQRSDIVYVVRKLGGAVPRHSQRQFLRRNAGAVVDDANERQTAPGGRHFYTARTGIERVLDQLLHDARRPLAHLAGGNTVYDRLRKLSDGHERMIGGFG